MRLRRGSTGGPSRGSSRGNGRIGGLTSPSSSRDSPLRSLAPPVLSGSVTPPVLRERRLQSSGAPSSVPPRPAPSPSPSPSPSGISPPLRRGRRHQPLKPAPPEGPHRPPPAGEGGETSHHLLRDPAPAALVSGLHPPPDPVRLPVTLFHLGEATTQGGKGQPGEVVQHLPVPPSVGSWRIVQEGAPSRPPGGRRGGPGSPPPASSIRPAPAWAPGANPNPGRSTREELGRSPPVEVQEAWVSPPRGRPDTWASFFRVSAAGGYVDEGRLPSHWSTGEGHLGGADPGRKGAAASAMDPLNSTFWTFTGGASSRRVVNKGWTAESVSPGREGEEGCGQHLVHG